MTFDPSLPARQRNGRKAIILGVMPAHLSSNDGYVISAMIESYEGDGWSLETFKADGRYSIKGNISSLDLVNIPIEATNETLQRHDRETGVMRSFPVLAKICRIEAMANNRCDNTVDAMSKLASIVMLARVAITHLIDRRENPLFPLGWEPTEDERWQAMNSPQPPMLKPTRMEAAE